MKVVSRSKASINVNAALRKAVSQINKDLENIDGVISNLGCEISVRPSGASISVVTTINGDQQCRKEVFGVNTRGADREHSLRKAAVKLNGLLEDRRGEIVDIYAKTVAPLPGMVYATIIAAVNECPAEPAVSGTSSRRNRIKKTLELLDNSPAAINIARLAEIFGVSRSIIYRDLEALGFDRVSESKK